MLAAKIHDIRTIFDQHTNLEISPDQSPDTKQIKTIEIEAKFGHYSEYGFNSNVIYSQYERLLKALRSSPNIDTEILEESEVAQAGNIRRITITNPGDEQEIILWQRKRRLQFAGGTDDIELYEYDIRVSANIEETLSIEEIPQSFTPKVIRHRSRHTFMLTNGVSKVDMTEVMMRGDDGVARPRYEVELEFLGTREDLYTFDQDIIRIFKLLKGTNIIYTNTVKNRLINDIIQVLGEKPGDGINKDVLVEARNIKRRDLVYGGIVGNQRILNDSVLAMPRRQNAPPKGTRYMITYKADGLRKFLIIHTTGVWLFYPPFEYNLVMDPSLNIPQLDKLLNIFNGTILDGELVLPKEHKPIDYWYLAFDCMAFRGKAGIQLQSYIERQNIVNAIAGALKTRILTIDTKDGDEIVTSQDFFRLVREYLERRNMLEYKEDGIMFIPIDIIYNPRSQNHLLKDRSLTRIPDICKWKESADITIDFEVRLLGDNKLDLYVYNDVNHVTEPFRGDTINPFTSDMIDHTNKLTRNLDSGVIVEYEWVKLPVLGEETTLSTQKESRGIFRPRRIRYDKSGPNRLSIAVDDWEDIMNPITASDIKGDTLMMSFSYHNRIKRSLYDILVRNPDYNPKQQTKGKRFKGINILDIGSGRGGDAAKWIRLKDNNDPTTGIVIAVEPNSDNREELIRRISTFELQDRVVIVPTGGEDTVSITDAVRKNVPGGKVDAVTLMLSLSFFWASDSHLDALVDTIVTNLKPGGQIVFLTIDGNVLEQIFEPALGGPIITDKNIVTSNIHLYPKIGIPFGRPLDFILPDTIVGEQREYIVHIQDFTSRLEKYGIYLHKFHRAEGEKLLSEENFLYSSMYSFGYYENTDRTALSKYEQNTFSPINIILPVIPPPIKSPVIQMTSGLTLPTLTIVGTHLPITSPTIPVLHTQQQLSTISPIQTTMDKNVIIPAMHIPIPQLQTDVTVPQFIVLEPVRRKLTGYEIEQNQLGWLPVSYSGKGGHIINGPARNDDTYAPLVCTWYNNLVRIATIGDGSCFIHAVLKAFYREYQENNDALYRLNIAAKIRRDLAIVLGLENPLYPNHTYWGTSARGAFPRMVMQQINDENLIGDLRVDYSLSGLQRLFNSTSQLGDEVYTFVADALNIDIYVLRATRDDLYPHFHTRRPGITRNGIVVIGNMYHYELMAVYINDMFQTVFLPDDPFLQALINLFIGDGDFADIVNTIPYDPDEAFIHDAAEAFTTQQGFDLPPVIEEIFPITDPFYVELIRLMPRIEQSAHLRYNTLNENKHPILLRLDNIINIMVESGFSGEKLHRLKEIVEHRLVPDIPQDLDAIIASAETDGLIDHDIVQGIINVEATL
jgi:SAM-dependent methyltransferase